MSASLVTMLQGLVAGMRPWVTVTPWESALRVRLGRHVRILRPGIHLVVPVLDHVYRQSVRKRSMMLPVQTLMRPCGKTLTLSGACTFEVSDIRRLYESLHDVEDTIGQICQCAIAECVATMTDPTPDAISRAAMEKVKFEQYGLARASINITDFAMVKTYRLIQDQRWGCYGRNVSTSARVGTEGG
jgi:hypothetical protein